MNLLGLQLALGGLMADVFGGSTTLACLAHGRMLSLGGPSGSGPVLTEALHPSFTRDHLQKRPFQSLWQPGCRICMINKCAQKVFYLPQLQSLHEGLLKDGRLKSCAGIGNSGRGIKKEYRFI